MTTGKYVAWIICSIAIFAWIGLAQAQQAKTVKLANGEEVVDIRGEWDDHIEHYGTWSGFGEYTNILKITLKGNSFVGSRMKGDPQNGPGGVAIRGELDKDGFKRVQIVSSQGLFDATGQISEDGNKIVIAPWSLRR